MLLFRYRVSRIPCYSWYSFYCCIFMKNSSLPSYRQPSSGFGSFYIILTFCRYCVAFFVYQCLLLGGVIDIVTPLTEACSQIDLHTSLANLKGLLDSGINNFTTSLSVLIQDMKEFLDSTTNSVCHRITTVWTDILNNTSELRSVLPHIIRMLSVILYYIFFILYFITVLYSQRLDISCFLYYSYKNYNIVYKYIIIIILIFILTSLVSILVPEIFSIIFMDGGEPQYYLNAQNSRLPGTDVPGNNGDPGNGGPGNNGNPENYRYPRDNEGPRNNQEGLTPAEKARRWKAYDQGIHGVLGRLNNQRQIVEESIQRDIDFDSIKHSIYNRNTWSDQYDNLTPPHRGLLNRILSDHTNYRIVYEPVATGAQNRGFIYPVHGPHKVVASRELIDHVIQAYNIKNPENPINR